LKYADEILNVHFNATYKTGYFMKSLPISCQLHVQHLAHGHGFKAEGLRGDTVIMDPYLMVDHYWMSQATFGAHPHAGFSAVTYMFEDAATGFHNRDSLGDDSIIRAGDLHWTTAGAGVVHDEVPLEPGKTAHGLQIFVNLAASKKHIPPHSIHLTSAQMPVVQQAGGARVKLIYGAYDDGRTEHSPAADFPTDAQLFDVHLQVMQRFEYPVPAGLTAFLLVVEGALEIDGQTIAKGQAVSFARSTNVAQLLITAREKSQFALFMGQPLNEAVMRRGPFAMTNLADLDRAAARYAAGDMGNV
jgi:redox-sensitive bicupin YhaK (pirin superfamily)